MIVHFAGAVTYYVVHFIEKNKDELSPKLYRLIEEQSKFAQLKQLAGQFRMKMQDDEESRKEAIER